MPTSKLPVEEPFFVHEAIVSLSRKNPTIFCNLHPLQRPDDQKPGRWDWYCDRVWVYKPVEKFLGRVAPKEGDPKPKIALFFKGYGTQIGTAVVELERVYWDSNGYPRLDFVHPIEMKRLHGCPNFWGAFILAIAKVRDDTEVFAIEDPEGLKFIEIAEKFAEAA